MPRMGAPSRNIASAASLAWRIAPRSSVSTTPHCRASNASVMRALSIVRASSTLLIVTARLICGRSSPPSSISRSVNGPLELGPGETQTGKAVGRLHQAVLHHVDQAHGPKDFLKVGRCIHVARRQMAHGNKGLVQRRMCGEEFHQSRVCLRQMLRAVLRPLEPDDLADQEAVAAKIAQVELSVLALQARL